MSEEFATVILLVAFSGSVLPRLTHDGILVTWEGDGMSDLRSAAILFAIFGLALLAYGLLLRVTGNEDLIPRRAVSSITGPEDVRRVGRLTMWVGAVILAVSILAIVLAPE